MANIHIHPDGQHSWLATGSADTTICVHYLGETDNIDTQGISPNVSYYSLNVIAHIYLDYRYPTSSYNVRADIQRSFGRDYGYCLAAR
jgi:hypothetical protein